MVQRIWETTPLTSLSRATIYRYIDAGHFPKQVSLGDHNVAWVEEEVMEWIQVKIANRDTNQDMRN